MCIRDSVRPVASRYGLDGHQPSVLPTDLLDQPLVVASERLVLEERLVEWRQDGREREAPQGFQVRRRRLRPVPGDTDGRDQPLLLRAHRGLEGSTGAGDPVELGEVTDGVQLQQVETVGLQALERGDDLGPRRVAPALTRLAGPVSYTHLRAHETVLDLVCRLLLEKK